MVAQFEEQARVEAEAEQRRAEARAWITFGLVAVAILFVVVMAIGQTHAG